MNPFTKLCAALLMAQLTAGALALDLSQAYQAALQQDATLNAARANADAGREGLPQARAQLLPNVSASFSRNKNKLDSTTPNILGIPTTTSSDYPSANNALTVRQPLYRRYQWAQYRQAQSQMDEIDAVLDTETQNLAVKVAGAYFEALLSQEQLGLIQTQKLTYRTHLDAATKMLAGGSGTRTEIDEAQARYDMSTAQELEALQHVDFTRQQLKTLINQPVDRLSALNPGKFQLAPPDPVQLEQWIERAEQASPELRSLRSRLETASIEVDKASSGHFPTLDAVLQWTRSTSENVQNIESSYENKTIGLQLNVPIYAGGGASAAVRQAVANKNRAEQLLEAGRRDLGVRVNREFRGVSEGVLRVRALEQAAKSAQQAVVSSQKSFQAGSRTRIDVLNAESSQMMVLRDLAQARFLYLISGLRLKALVNEANLPSVEAMNQVFQP